MGVKREEDGGDDGEDGLKNGCRHTRSHSERTVNEDRATETAGKSPEAASGCLSAASIVARRRLPERWAVDDKCVLSHHLLRSVFFALV
jgi:hypothetical protein